MVKQAGRKTGNFAAGGKGPQSKEDQGLDWGKIRAARARRLEEEYERGIRNADTIEHHHLMELDAEDQRAYQKKLEAKAAEPVRSHRSTQERRDAARQGGQKKGPRWDVDEGVRLYLEENLMPKDIAKKLGITYETVVKGLKYRQVFDPNKYRGNNGVVRPAHTYHRQKYCPKCQTDLDQPGASRDRIRKLPDGSTRPAGRECIPCTRERNRAHREKSNGQG